jgi:hypothetical protein
MRSLGVSRADGPAIGLTTADHRLTRTFAGRGARTIVNDVNKQGSPLNARERMYLDIMDLRRNFGRKYNRGSLEAIEYSKTLPEFRVRRAR